MQVNLSITPRYLRNLGRLLISLMVGGLLTTAPHAARVDSAPAWPANAQIVPLSKTDFEVIEGMFHDGLGTFAEVSLANALMSSARIAQAPFDATHSKDKMTAAIERLPPSHPSRTIFANEIRNISLAAELGAKQLLDSVRPAKLSRVLHTPREYSGARAGDLRLQFSGSPDLPVSVKTDKSGKVAIAEGQTPEIKVKWAERFFRVSDAEFDQMIRELKFQSVTELKSDYLNVAEFVASVLIRKLKLKDCRATDFGSARVGDLAAAKFLFHQLLRFKHGNDNSRVIILDRTTGEVKWESLLDSIDVESLTADRISFLPSRPREGHRIGSEFGIRIDGRTVVSFQIKHKRGRARGTAHQYEFSDITTRLRL